MSDIDSSISCLQVDDDVIIFFWGGGLAHCAHHQREIANHLRLFDPIQLDVPFDDPKSLRPPPTFTYAGQESHGVSLGHVAARAIRPDVLVDLAKWRPFQLREGFRGSELSSTNRARDESFLIILFAKWTKEHYIMNVHLQLDGIPPFATYLGWTFLRFFILGISNSS